MTTIVQLIPRWLRPRAQRVEPQKLTTQQKKQRQVLPTMSERARLAILAQDDSPAGYRILWHM